MPSFPDYQTSLAVRLREAILRRTKELWEKSRRAERPEDIRQRTRAEVEAEFQQRTAEVGEPPRRWSLPLEIEEALTPGKSREPGGLKWGRKKEEKGQT